MMSKMREMYKLLDIIAACRDACGPLMRLESGIDVEAVGNPEAVPQYIREVIASLKSLQDENSTNYSCQNSAESKMTKNIKEFTAEETFEMIKSGQFTHRQFEQWVISRMQEACNEGWDTVINSFKVS